MTVSTDFQGGLEIIMQYLPILIPLAIIQLGLLVAALIHIGTHKTFKAGNQVVWIIVCIAFNTIGPIIYFIFGRGDTDTDGDGD